jgi:phage gp37-like protein
MIAAVENAIIARLVSFADSGALGYVYRTKETYPADWDAYLKEKTISYPAVWTSCGGWRGGTSTDNKPVLQLVIGVVVAAQNIRNEEATRHGAETQARNEVGSYQMAEDVVRMVHGSDLGLEIDPLQVGDGVFVRLDAALKEAKTSMLAVQFTATFSLERFPEPGELDDFEKFAASWDVPPVFDPPSPDLETLTTLPTEEPVTP